MKAHGASGTWAPHRLGLEVMDFSASSLLAQLADLATPQNMALVVGVALLLLGARVYRLAVVAPGVLAGVWLASEVTGSQPEQNRLIAMGRAVLIQLLLRPSHRLDNAGMPTRYNRTHSR